MQGKYLAHVQEENVLYVVHLWISAIVLIKRVMNTTEFAKLVDIVIFEGGMITMKKISVILLTLLFAITVLTGCNSSQPVSEIEQATTITTSDLESISQTWYQDRLYKSDETGDLAWVTTRDGNFIFNSHNTTFTVITSSPEYGSDDSGQFIRYTQDQYHNGELYNSLYVLYYPENDSIVTFDLADKYGSDCYVFYKAMDTTIGKPTPEENNAVEDTVRYRCFETELGEVTFEFVGLHSQSEWVDFTATLDSNTILSMSFEAEDIEVTDDGYKYSVDYMGEPDCTISFTISGETLEWNCDAMYADMNGEYIQLPDTSE